MERIKHEYVEEVDDTTVSFQAKIWGLNKRFEAEIDSLKKLRHEGIVRLFGYGEEDGIVFYSMELVDGPSLEQEINRGRRFDWNETLVVAVQVCRALKHAHDSGIVHRDLKPANLLVDGAGPDPDAPGGHVPAGREAHLEALVVVVVGRRGPEREGGADALFSAAGYEPVRHGFAMIRPGGVCPACDALHNVTGGR